MLAYMYPWSWFFGGALIVAIVGGLVWWFKNKGINLTWYEWLIGIIGLLLLAFALQNFFGALSEYEYDAAPLFLLIVGLPGLIMIGVVFQLVNRRKAKVA